MNKANFEKINFYKKNLKLNDMLYTTDYISPVGKLNIVSDEKSLIGVWFYKQKYFQSTITEKLQKSDDIDILQKTIKWFDDYFNGLKPKINDLNLKPKGSEFRKRVWKILCEIPYGETLTYGEIANKFENMAPQAVGGAVGHNPISIIIPCHRVLGKNNKVTGYAGGVDKKIKLLAHEGLKVRL